MDSALDRLISLTVADVMSRDVISVGADVELAEAAHLFNQRGIAAAPVVDPQGACIGILSSTDVMRVLWTTEQEAATADSQPASEWPRRTAAEFMTSAVQSVAPSESLLQAARMMCAQHVHRLLVLDHRGKPVGVISTMDIVAALLQALDEVEQYLR
jgi:CBS-domain-containing membrane protein